MFVFISRRNQKGCPRSLTRWHNLAVEDYYTQQSADEGKSGGSPRWPSDKDHDPLNLGMVKTQGNQLCSHVQSPGPGFRRISPVEFRPWPLNPGMVITPGNQLYTSPGDSSDISKTMVTSTGPTWGLFTLSPIGYKLVATVKKRKNFSRQHQFATRAQIECCKTVIK